MGPAGPLAPLNLLRSFANFLLSKINFYTAFNWRPSTLKIRDSCLRHCAKQYRPSSSQGCVGCYAKYRTCQPTLALFIAAVLGFNFLNINIEIAANLGCNMCRFFVVHEVISAFM